MILRIQWKMEGKPAQQTERTVKRKPTNLKAWTAKVIRQQIGSGEQPRHCEWVEISQLVKINRFTLWVSEFPEHYPII